MTFFQKILKPSYELDVSYNSAMQLYHYKVTVKAENHSGVDCQLKLDQDQIYEGDLTDNPVGAFWHYNNADLPGFLLSD